MEDDYRYYVLVKQGRGYVWDECDRTAFENVAMCGWRPEWMGNRQAVAVLYGTIVHDTAGGGLSGSRLSSLHPVHERED